MVRVDGVAELDEPIPRHPHPGLAGLVDRYVGYDWVGPPSGVHRGLPSTSMTVVFAFDVPLDAGWYSAPNSRARHWALLSGLHTVPAEIHHRGRQRGIQLALTAEGARLLCGMPMRALAAEIVTLDDALGPSVAGWAQLLQDQPSWSARYDLIDTLLLRLRREHDRVAGPRAELARARDRIEDDGGRLTVSALADDVGWSRRHLTAQFAAEFGLAPKEYARVVRFDRAKQRLLAGAAPIEVAGATGYADQAHLTREWRAMAGCSPREWQRLEVPFLQDVGPTSEEDGRHD